MSTKLSLNSIKPLNLGQIGKLIPVMVSCRRREGWGGGSIDYVHMNMYVHVLSPDPTASNFNGEIQLDGQPPDFANQQLMGQVTVYGRMNFGMVCSDTFNDIAAAVTCNQLGHIDGGDLM